MNHAAPLAPTRAPRRSQLPRHTAMQLAATEYDRMSAMLAELRPDDWSLRTDCAEWDVRQLASHLLGMASMVTSPMEVARQQKAAKKVHATRGGQMIDSLTQVQVDERADRGPAELVAEAERIGRRAVRGRRLLAIAGGRMKLPEPEQVDGRSEYWTVGYLMGTILTRDPWMHRIDLARATGHALELTPEHDGVIVDDVVREWAERHGQAYHLELTGPAGGQWASDELRSGTDTIAMDAVEFCRILSGRATGTGLLTTSVPF
ncbi:maleylpyruvate isomerase family mycothiol-dependent enzyme [Nocardioides sp. Soil796]|uniref:maleylpyruvate isomerase family mycothiol-dependent enzyme n=1 Tax=Nocardioides sp. Soil796 TaxID=1736412 RepID=UPI000AB5F11B|nr:maleylpyruvate isomerase family mycothiol-dependent enzyme [Nocardioides sp. Soil796]